MKKQVEMHLPSCWAYEQTSNCTWHAVHQKYETRIGTLSDGVFTWQEQDGQEYKASVDENGMFVCYLSKPPFDGCKTRATQAVRKPSVRHKISFWYWNTSNGK